MLHRRRRSVLTAPDWPIAIKQLGGRHRMLVLVLVCGAVDVDMPGRRVSRRHHMGTGY